MTQCDGRAGRRQLQNNTLITLSRHLKLGSMARLIRKQHLLDQAAESAHRLSLRWEVHNPQHDAILVRQTLRLQFSRVPLVGVVRGEREGLPQHREVTFNRCGQTWNGSIGFDYGATGGGVACDLEVGVRRESRGVPNIMQRGHPRLTILLGSGNIFEVSISHFLAVYSRS